MKQKKSWFIGTLSSVISSFLQAQMFAKAHFGVNQSWGQPHPTAVTLQLANKSPKKKKKRRGGGGGNERRKHNTPANNARVSSARHCCLSKHASLTKRQLCFQLVERLRPKAAGKGALDSFNWRLCYYLISQPSLRKGNLKNTSWAWKAAL